jgi:hypothetical protein
MPATRTIPPALRRALNARDRGCRFPGSPNTRYVDAHHIHHWAQGGETKLSNLIQILDDGALRFDFEINFILAERVGFEPTCRNYPTIRFRVGAVMTASVPLRRTPF